MCIVSFVKNKEKFILTFNRDELSERRSERPEWRLLNGKNVFCPLDKEAGGTWIGYNKNILVCIQNGAMYKHIRQLPYRKSRGIIVKEILEIEAYEALISISNFNNIEPFTLSIFDIELSRLKIYRFDGSQLMMETDDLKKALVLTSSTLYDEVAQRNISSDFKNLNSNPKTIFNFHDEHRIGQYKNKYTTRVSTVSITQFILEGDHFSCKYFDANTNENYLYRDLISFKNR